MMAKVAPAFAIVLLSGGTMGDFKKLVAWQKAHEFAIAVHKAFTNRRVNVSPGLRAQILTAVNAIPDNLAEGCGKRSRRALAAHAETGYGSAKEVENQLIKSRDLRILSRSAFETLIEQCDEVKRLCFGLTRVPPNAD
jgi:four helix bundle protein